MRNIEMLEPLELEIARAKIERYEHDADEAVVRDSKLAQECADCEEFLQTGIHALVWLERSEETIVEAVSEGVFEMTPRLEEAIEALHQAWLRPCGFAEKWIAKCQKNGYDIKNLAEFRDCCERAQDWLEQNAWHKQARATQEERFAQEPW